MKTIARVILSTVFLCTIYLLVLPVEVQPVAWQAPDNTGYVGDFAPNTALKSLDKYSLGEFHGPEDVVMDANGHLYMATHEGAIIRLDAEDKSPKLFAHTQGRPLGLCFDARGQLLVADAYKGLLTINPKGDISVLTHSVNGSPILYANNLDVADDGKVYFSDSSTRFGAQQYGGSYPASLLDLMEHGSHGRILVYDPKTLKTTVLLTGLNFPNGIAVAHDGRSLLMNETGNYRVLRLWLTGDKKGEQEELITALPGFPDNLTRGLDGRYWLGLVSPRNPMLDAISDKPFLRKMVQRLPGFLRPKATRYSHVIAINDAGEVVSNLQDPTGAYAINTGVLETDDTLYIASLVEKTLAYRANPFAQKN